MFILMRGELLQLDVDKETTIAKIPEGSVFGETVVLRNLEASSRCGVQLGYLACLQPASTASHCFCGLCASRIRNFSPDNRYSYCLCFLKVQWVLKPQYHW